MSPRTAVKESSKGYGQAAEVLRNTLPDLAAPIEKHIAALREESYENRVTMRALEQEITSLKKQLGSTKSALLFALGSQRVDS